MALSSELHEALARRRQPLQRELRLEARPEESRDISSGEDPDDVIDPDDRSQADIAATIDIAFEVPPALPPPQPSWSFLRDRAGASVSVLLARCVLESVGCYLSIHPPSNTLCEANRCRSAGALRRLIADVYGQCGLDVAYQMGGIRKQLAEIRHKVSENTKTISVETAEKLVSRLDFTSQARLQRWFQREKPVPAAWHSSPPPAESDAGAWVG